MVKIHLIVQEKTESHISFNIRINAYLKVLQTPDSEGDKKVPTNITVIPCIVTADRLAVAVNYTE